MRIVIVGNGVAGVTCAFAARERDTNAQITIVGGETDFFFSRTALMYAFMDTMQRRDLEPFEQGVWKRRRIDLIRDWVVDIDGGARHVKLANGQALPYDKLVLAVGARPRKAEWPGLETVAEGVVNFVSMQDLDACEALVATTKRAVVVGGGLIGIELVECLLHHGIETTFLIREPYYWPAALSREESAFAVERMRHHGAQVLLEDGVTRVEARDRRVAKVYTSSGKELPCDMLGVCIGVQANIDRLRSLSTPLELGRGVVVDDRFRTSVPDIFACGDCAEILLPDGTKLVELIWYSAKRHGALVARNLFGDDVPYARPVFFNSSKFFDLEFTTVGEVELLPEGTPTIYRSHPTKPVTQRIVHDGTRVLGFNMMGSRWDHAHLARWIEERRSPEYALAHLHEAQFDVEFGKTQLAALTQTNLPLAKIRK